MILRGILDNPHALVDAVERSGAHSTDLQEPENVRELAAKCEEAAAAWAPVAFGICDFSPSFYSSLPCYRNKKEKKRLEKSSIIRIT